MPLKKLIMCDIQRDYLKCMSLGFMTNCMDYVKRARNILCIYNDFGDTSEQDMRDFYADYGVAEKTLDRVEFRPKEYGFFRDVMEECNDDAVLGLLDIMRNNGTTDSREVKNWEDYGAQFDDHVLKNLLDGTCVLYYPNIDTDTFRRYDHCTLIGGSRDACLRELAIWLRHIGVHVTINQQFVY